MPLRLPSQRLATPRFSSVRARSGARAHSTQIGDRRPYLVALITIDPEEAPAFAEKHGLAVEDLPESEQMRAEVQSVVDNVNATVGPVEQVKRFKILPHDLTQETGELTPTLKVKRNVVNEKNDAEIDALYAG